MFPVPPSSFQRAPSDRSVLHDRLWNGSGVVDRNPEAERRDQGSRAHIRHVIVTGELAINATGELGRIVTNGAIRGIILEGESRLCTDEVPAGNKSKTTARGEV